MKWRYGFQAGVWIGFLGGVVVASGFNFFVVLALVMQASLFGLALAISYKIRDKLQQGRRNQLKLIVAFCTGAAILFIVSLYYFEFVFQTAVLVVIVIAPIYPVYLLVQVWSTRTQVSVPVRHFVRNVFAMVGVMGPLLFIVVFAVEPIVKGPLPLIGWAVANSAFGLIILINFLRERKRPTIHGD